MKKASKLKFCSTLCSVSIWNSARVYKKEIYWILLCILHSQKRRMRGWVEIFFFLVSHQTCFSVICYVIQGNIRAFVSGLLFTMLCNLCLTEVRPVFWLCCHPYGLCNLAGWYVIRSALSNKKKISEVKGKISEVKASFEVSRFEGNFQDFGIMSIFSITRASHMGCKKIRPFPCWRGGWGAKEGVALASGLLDLSFLLFCHPCLLSAPAMSSLSWPGGAIQGCSFSAAHIGTATTKQLSRALNYTNPYVLG